MNKENKLGMGLGALLSTTNNKNETNNNVQKINISQIIPNPLQPRKNFKNESEQKQTFHYGNKSKNPFKKQWR